MKRLVIGGTLLAAVAGATGYFIAARNPVKADKAADDFLPWVATLFDVMGKLDWLNVLLVGAGFVVMLMLIVWQLQPGDGFDMRSMFAGRDPVSGKWNVEPGRVFQTGAFCATSWALVWVVTHDKLTEIFLFVYVALWAGSRAMNQVVASKFPVTPGTSLLTDQPPQQPVPVTTVTTETKVTTP